jgi:acetyltransferase-like isoleucine patch superfamily enzyme
MAFHTEFELTSMGFKRLGKNVLISRDARIHNADQIEIGDNSRIDDFCSLSGKITIGKNVHIASFGLLAGGEPGIDINDFSGCAYGVKIFTQNDNYFGQSLTGPTIPKKFKLGSMAPVKIEELVIIGTNSTILPGVTIKEGSSIGAHSLVVSDTEPWSLYRGNPASFVSKNSRNALEMKIEYLNEL